MAPRKKPGVVCTGCEHEYPLEETRFESVEEAEGQDYICRVCVLVSRLDRLEEEKEQLRAQVGQLQEEVKEERKQRKALEARLAQMDDELATRGDVPRKYDVAVGHETGVPAVLGPEQGTREDNDNTPENDPERALTQTVRQQVATPGGRQEKEERRMVIVAGDSNMRYSEREIRGRVREDERVQVGVFPGQTVRVVLEKAKEKMWENMQGQNLVVIAGGTNDVLQGRGAGVRKQLEKGVKELRALCPHVQVVVSTVPEIIGKGVHVEREVVAVNRDIRELSKEMSFAVVDINSDVRWVGRNRAFQRDGIHFCGHVGAAIGRRHAARTVAFLGGPQAFAKMA